MRKWASIKNKIPSASFLLSLLFLWEFAGRKSQLPEYILPLPSSIFKALVNNQQLLVDHSVVTIIAAILGLVAAIVFSVLIAYLMNKFKIIKDILYPLLVISQTIPIIALAPIMMIWFGLGLMPKILTVALVCFFPLTINITEGLRTVDREEIELLQVMGANPWQIFRNIQLPFVLPYFFSGLRISATYSVMGAVIGEWLGGNKGLGVFMIRSMHTYNVSNLFAAIVVVIILSILFFKIVELISWLIMPWNRNKGDLK